MLRNIAVLCLLGLTLGACSTTPWNDDAPDSMNGGPAPGDPAPMGNSGLLAAVDRRFKDVPLPVNVTEDQERSYVYESSTLQIGRMVYYSRSSMNELSQFYVDECARLGWKLESALQANGADLKFRKPGKKLDVSVQPQGVGRSNILIVHLTPDDAGAIK